MNRCYVFLGVGSSGAPPTSLTRWGSLTDAMLRRCVGSSGAELKDSSPNPYYLHLQERRMNRCSTVGSSGAEAPVLERLCLDSNEASNRPMVSSLSPSYHPVLLTSLLFMCKSSDASWISIVGSSDSVNFISASAQCTKCSDTCTDGTVGSSDGVFSFFSSRLQLGSLLQLNILNILNMPLLIAPKYMLTPHFCYK
jgi:hypothetical protein